MHRTGRWRTGFVAVFAFAFACPAAAQAPDTAAVGAYVEAVRSGEVGAGWTLTGLDLDITIRPEQARASVAGVARLRLDADSSRGPTLMVNSRGAVMRWVSAESDGAADVSLNEPLALREALRAAHLRFDRPFARGDEVDVRFELESEGQSFQWVVGPEAALASWVEGWHPAPAPLSPAGFGASLITAPGTTRFRLPTGWKAVHNGRLVSRDETPGGATETWELAVPVARSFVAAPFIAERLTAGGRDVGVYLLAPKPESIENQVRTLSDALTAMEARFGPYPYPSYAIAEVPETLVSWYASSEQGFIMARTSAFEVEGGNVPLFAHEAAHGWWGNLVGVRGAGAMLCGESLAQYGAVVAIEAIEGPEAATEFLEYSREGYNPLQCALGYFYLWREGFDTPMVELANGPHHHNLSDAKGHWIYHMLRGRVGDDVFFATLRGLIRDHAGSQMSLDDVRAAFIAAAPDKALDVFFEQWLERTGAPVLACDWWTVGRGGGRVRLEIAQSQEAAPYALSMEVALALHGGGEQRETVDLRERRHVFEFQTSARVVGVTLDPDRRLLIWRPQYGPRPGGEETDAAKGDPAGQ